MVEIAKSEAKVISLSVIEHLNILISFDPLENPLLHIFFFLP